MGRGSGGAPGESDLAAERLPGLGGASKRRGHVYRHRSSNHGNFSNTAHSGSKSSPGATNYALSTR